MDGTFLLPKVVEASLQGPTRISSHFEDLWPFAIPLMQKIGIFYKIDYIELLCDIKEGTFLNFST